MNLFEIFLIFIYFLSAYIAALYGVSDMINTYRAGKDITVGDMILNTVFSLTPFVNTVFVLSVIRYEKFFDFVIFKGRNQK